MSGKLELFGRFDTAPSVNANLNYNIHFTPEDNSISRASTNPISKPKVEDSFDTAYSMERYVYFKVTRAPDNTMTNFRLWSPVTSSPSTGVFYYIGTNESYTKPSTAKSTKATHKLHTAYYSYSNALRLYNSLTSINETTRFIIIQAVVTTTAPTGLISSTRTGFNFAYDES